MLVDRAPVRGVLLGELDGLDADGMEPLGDCIDGFGAGATAGVGWPYERSIMGVLSSIEPSRIGIGPP